ncbi:MAG: hypothetical protein WC205_13685 [Opitutaceae bacterium]|jgi:hypothetical protein
MAAASLPLPTSIPGTATPRWCQSVVSGAIAWALSLFMAAPPFSSWSRVNIDASRAADYLRLCHAPLSRNLVEGMLAYRIATPTLAWLLHLPDTAALALPYVFSLAALIVIHRAVRFRSDSLLADAATIGVACSSTFLYSHYCLGYIDSLTHLGAAVALIAAAPLSAVAVLIAGLNDERIVLALPFIALWRCPASCLANWKSPQSWISFGRATAPLAGGLAGVLFVRHALTAGWLGPGVSMPPLYHQIADTVRQGRPWLESWSVWFVNWLKGPGWLWLFIAAPFLSARWRPALPPAIVLGFCFVLACVSTFIVADVARSIGFAFPAALLCILWVHGLNASAARKLAVVVASLQVVTPAVWIYQGWQWVQFRPLLWEFWLFVHNSR